MTLHTIILPLDYPYNCRECPLLGTRPEDELTPGDKFTRFCFFPGQEKPMSGRGTRQTAARCRCGEKQYKRMLIQHAGEVKISATDAVRFHMEQMAFIFEKRERQSK